MSNPILGRVEQDARNGYVGFRDHAQTPQGGYQQAPTQTYGSPQGYGQQGYPQGGYQQTQPGFPQDPTIQGGGGWGGGGGRSVTIDDVIMKTGALFAVMLAVAAPAWFLAPTFGLAIWGVGLVGGLAITLYLMFAKKPVSPALAIAYAVFQGLFVGAISRSYHEVFDVAVTGQTLPIFQSIVVQAVLATLCVFGAMLFLYKSGIVKVTQKFRAVVSMMVLGYFVFALINLAYALITSTSFGIGGSGPIGIAISVFAVGLASVTLALDFDNIDTAIQTRAPEAYSWTLALGLVATLVWLYLEILRLLGRLRSE